MRELRARLSPQAGRAWDKCLIDARVTASALIEAMGREMAEGWKPPAKLLRLAAEIDRDRRSR